MTRVRSGFSLCLPRRASPGMPGKVCPLLEVGVSVWSLQTTVYSHSANVSAWRAGFAPQRLLLLTRLGGDFGVATKLSGCTSATTKPLYAEFSVLLCNVLLTSSTAPSAPAPSPDRRDRWRRRQVPTVRPGRAVCVSGAAHPANARRAETQTTEALRRCMPAACCS